MGKGAIPRREGATAWRGGEDARVGPTEPTERFTGRARHYARGRPGYPGEVLEILRTETGLRPGMVVADVGSGTGISARLFLRHGNRVHAVEPNPDMRRTAEELLGGESGFHSIAGTAAQTGLQEAGVDYVVCAQSFHWLDPDLARREFARILRPGGWIVLLWNTRRTGSSPFLRSFEALLRVHGTDYEAVRHDRLPESRVRRLFADGYEKRVLENRQLLDFPGLRARLLSMSYVPAEGETGHGAMMAELRRVFQRHAMDGRVGMEYETELYLGRPPAPQGRDATRSARNAGR